MVDPMALLLFAMSASKATKSQPPGSGVRFKMKLSESAVLLYLGGELYKVIPFSPAPTLGAQKDCETDYTGLFKVPPMRISN